MKNRFKCPYCGSTNILFWKELVYTFEYKMTKKGIPSKRGTKHPGLTEELNYGYKCVDCGTWVSCNAEDSSDWEICE